jgi:hypothetical protein
MEAGWRRPKTLPSKTHRIPTTEEGTLHLTLAYEDDTYKKLVEVRATIGKAGSYANTITDTCCKLISIVIQSPLSREKICKKFKKQFVDMASGIAPFEYEGKKYTCVIDVIIKMVIGELEK